MSEINNFYPISYIRISKNGRKLVLPVFVLKVVHKGLINSILVIIFIDHTKTKYELYKIYSWSTL